MNLHVPCPPPVWVPVFPKTAPSSLPLWTDIFPLCSRTLQLLLTTLSAISFPPVITGVAFLPAPAHSWPPHFGVPWDKRKWWWGSWVWRPFQGGKSISSVAAGVTKNNALLVIETLTGGRRAAWGAVGTEH